MMKFTRFLILTYFLGSLTNVLSQSDLPTSAEYKAYNNFSFIAGTKVIFYDDFSDGLSKWKTIEFDQAEGVEPPGIKSIDHEESKWFKTPRRGVFYPKTLSNLPENFTIEFDMWADSEKMSEMESGLILTIVGNKVDKNEYSTAFDSNPQIQIDIHPSAEMLYCLATKENYDGERLLIRKDVENGWKLAVVHRISISRKATHVQVFVNEKLIIDLPNGLPQKLDYTLVLATNMWGDGLYFTNFKIAEITESQPLKIDADNKLVTNAIYFNVNSAVIKPESWPALNQVAMAIKSSQGVIKIIGHTDSDGSEADNLILSKKRAESIKNMLVKNFGIPDSKLVTDGVGELEPVDDNNTAEGKANNRRVEFVIQ